MKLEYSYLNLIWIKEIPGLVNGVIGIVEKYDSETLGVKPFFDLLVLQQSQLESYTDPRVSHPLTPVIIADRKRSIELAQAIVSQAKAVEKGKIPAVSEAAFLIVPLIKKYLYKIAQSNSKSVDKSVKSFLAALKDSELLSKASTTTGIDQYVDELMLIYNKMDINTETRRADNAGRRLIKEKKLKGSIMGALTNLLKAIDLAQVHNTAVDYTLVIAELNELFVPYRTLTRSRSTRNKNAIVKKQAVASSPTTTATAG